LSVVSADDKLAGVEDLKYITAPAELSAINESTTAIQFGMASELLVGTLLRVLAASKPGGRLLELGTGTGIATAWLLSGMDDRSTLESVDNDASVQQVAARALGKDARLKLVTSGAIEYLCEQSPNSFDLVFADAMPGKYEGLSEALAVIKPGGFYVIDNMLPQPNWPEGHFARIPVLMDQLAQQERFSVLPLVWASGVVVAVKKDMTRP